MISVDAVTREEVPRQDLSQVIKPHEVRDFLLENWGRKCAYCGKSDRTLVIEHIIPRCRGGTDALFNLTLSCYDCNISKAGKTALEFGFPEVQKKAILIGRSTKIAGNHRDENWYLYILGLMSSGKSPAQISRELSIPKTTLQHYLNNLKRNGLISKIGYGVWELSGEGISSLKRSTLINHVANQQDPKEVPILQQKSDPFFFAKPDSVRAHAFVFTVSVPPHLHNWNNKTRAKYLTHHNISFTELNIGGGGQRIIFKGKKVWLTDRSVVIYDRSSYLAESSSEAKSYAISKLLSLVKGLERLLHADFTERAGRNYTFRVSRQHYALIKNALAKQYNAEGKKLNIYSDKGLWFVIDNSFNLHEAETVHPETADTDNATVQSWFNGLKEQPITPEFLTQTLNGILQSQQNNQQIQSVFSENMSSHIQVLKDIGINLNNLTELIGELKEHGQLSKGQRTLEVSLE